MGKKAPIICEAESTTMFGHKIVCLTYYEPNGQYKIFKDMDTGKILAHDWFQYEYKDQFTPDVVVANKY